MNPCRPYRPKLSILDYVQVFGIIGWVFQGILYDISHSYKQNIFATCGEGVNVYDYNRTTPIRTFDWGVDTVHKIRFNPVEVSI